ncbi:MAG: 2-polyprenylphenol 6-hydroxylase [Pseudomonadota bacterium]
MRGPHNLWRLIRTGATFERTGAMRIAIDLLDLSRPVKIAARVLGVPFAPLGLKGDPSEPPVLRAIEALGPAYIKFGQLMSTRPDIVGAEMAAELRVLQDSLPAFPMEQAKATIAAEFGESCEDIFSEFSEPVAAASIAQVHKARLKSDGRAVAVKILRPDIERAFGKDVDAFHFSAWLVEMISPASRRLRPRAVIEHFATVVEQELDLRTEAAAASEFRANSKDDAGFEVPKIVWDYSSRQVMVMDWEEGIPLADVDALAKSGHDLKQLGAHIVQTFLRHALRDGYFHADMHQGNLKLAPNGDLIALDFGIMGRIDTYTRRVYAEILMGFIRRDYRRVAEVHFEAGYVPQDQDVDAFAQSLRAVGEPIFGQDATQISMARLLSHLFEVTERFGMQTRTELILLQRTMVVVEGVGRSLDPTLNIWSTARPVVEQYITENLGPKAILADLGKAAQSLARFGPRLPEIIDRYLAEPEPEEKSRNLKTVLGYLGAVFGGILLGGALAFWLL